MLCCPFSDIAGSKTFLLYTWSLFLNRFFLMYVKLGKCHYQKKHSLNGTKLDKHMKLGRPIQIRNSHTAEI